jgi:hypothetical protein
MRQIYQLEDKFINLDLITYIRILKEENERAEINLFMIGHDFPIYMRIPITKKNDLLKTWKDGR